MRVLALVAGAGMTLLYLCPDSCRYFMSGNALISSAALAAVIARCSGDIDHRYRPSLPSTLYPLPSTLYPLPSAPFLFPLPSTLCIQCCTLNARRSPST
jgi:hypothetical protein